MKNLSAIPRLSPFAAFTILITLVVCLADITGAEVFSNHKEVDLNRDRDEDYFRKQLPLKESAPYPQKTTKTRGDELSQRSDVNDNDNNNNKNNNIKNARREASLKNYLKRQSNDFGETDEFDSEKESDGYGYDDDEYYHFNFKRNDDVSEGGKIEKEGIGEANKKEGLSSQKFMPNRSQKENSKETETIEMLNFKETHPNIAFEKSQSQNSNANSFAIDNAHKKTSSSDPVDTIKMSDLKQNSALDEKIKDRKEDSVNVINSASTEQKIEETKPESKGTNEKESLKMKESKAADDSEKKDKDINLKEEKDSMVSKNIKENAKNSEDKEKIDQDIKNVKLNENTKLEDNIEKFSKSKESDAAKLSKEDKGSDAVNPNEVSQINNRANLVSNDYKDNVDAMKTSGVEEDEKISEEINENEKNVELSDYQDDPKERKENLREGERTRNYEYANRAEGNPQFVHGEGKMNDFFSLPITFEIRTENPGDYYKKRESWKDHIKQAQHEQQQDQHQLQMGYDRLIRGPYRLNFPQSELDNTDYHKNYIKSLRRYKGLDDSTKVLSPDPSSFTSVEKNNYEEKKEAKKKKRSKVKNKKRTTFETKSSQGSEKSENTHSNVRRDAYTAADLYFREFQPFLDHPVNSQLSGKENILNDEGELNGRIMERFENRPERERRKSPQKLEYEIKIINQNQDESKSAPVSSFMKNRKKKKVKRKLFDLRDDKIMQKYPYSQASTDDLIQFAGSEYGGEKKFKRKDFLWQQKEQSDVSKENSHVKIRGVPSGYYGNRVKFGQKHFIRNDDGQSSDAYRMQSSSDNSASESYNQISPNFNKGQSLSSFGCNHRAPASFGNSKFSSSLTSSNERNSFQHNWDGQGQSHKHDPMKRFDDNNYLNVGSNSLLLVKKDRNGQRITKTFSDGNSKGSEEEMDPDRLAKILSKDNEYVVLKRTDKNKFQKITDSENSGSHFDNEPFSNKKTDLLKAEKQDNIKGGSKKVAVKARGLFTRSYHADEEKKLADKSRNSGTKSNLKKTFEKFKDLADFFKDNDQESQENQHPTQEAKESSDIVFSEDKLPDPIIINEVDAKNGNLKSKSQNSMSYISTNFKQLDQDRKSNTAKESESGKNMFVSEVKPDNGESWEPALKNAFPEAKSINSIQKNGNEIIVLDFNRNQLKTERGKNMVPHTCASSRPQSFVSGVNQNSLVIPGDRQVEVIVEDNSLLQPNYGKQLYPEKMLQTDKASNIILNSEDGTLTLSGDGNGPQITIPINQLPQLPNLLKSLAEKKQNIANEKYKLRSKKSSQSMPSTELSPSFNQFLKDYNELSDLKKDSLKKGKLTDKRHYNGANILTSSFPELTTYSDANVRQLGNLLQNIMSNENVANYRNKELSYHGGPRAVYKNLDNTYQKSNIWYPNAPGYITDPVLRRQGQWTSAEERRKDNSPYYEKSGLYISDEMRQEINNLLQSEGMKGENENEHQDELWEELSAASDKIQRLRREGAGKRKLRKTIEDALSFRERRQSEKNDKVADIVDNAKKPDSNSKLVNTRSEADAEKSKIEKTSLTENSSAQKADTLQQVVSSLKEEGKENPEVDKSLSKSDSENHLNELPENSNSVKNEKEQLMKSNESKVNRRKRRYVHRRKRSLQHDIKNKVSRNEVGNKILKNLVEDNYQSIYSSGLKRKLLSIEDEEDDHVDYFDTDGSGNREVAGKSQRKYLDVNFNKCAEPKVSELFGTEGSEENKNRVRRSLTNTFHTDVKREIDLDESMPNDFENFLVTSLGGFGSQKREVVKKDEALWEGKESSQDNLNQIVDNSVGGKDVSEDSALEKREAPNNEIRKHGSSKESSDYFENGTESDSSEVLETLKSNGKKARSQEKSAAKSKTEFDDEKVPTQIRIQITNASSKEKKSSKPIMDDSETNSIEIDSVPKEKEFFEKNKLNSLHINNPQKVHPFPKSKYAYAVEYGDGDSTDSTGKQKLYVVARPYRRNRRKKKKFVQENPMKTIRDFTAFDQKAMESLLRKYFSDQQGATTQKIPISNHLPQVETVYNPTQGTNKAQLEAYRTNKVNPINTKTAANDKNSLQTSDVSAFDDGILRSYLKEKAKAKGDKCAKEFEDVDWKPCGGKIRAKQDSGRDTQLGSNMRGYKTFGSDTATSTVHVSTNSPSRFYNPYSQVKWYQPPYNSYLYHAPSSTALNQNSVYDNYKAKQDYQNWSGLNKDRGTSKSWPKSYYLTDGSLVKPENKEKMPTSYTSHSGDNLWNSYDYFSNKKPLAQKYKARDYYGIALKNQADGREKSELSPSKYKFFKTVDDEKPVVLDTSQSHVLDTTKDADYFDGLEEDYIDDDSTKQDTQFDDQIGSDPLKKPTKTYENGGYQHLFNLKNAEVDDSLGEDDEELDDDYDEASEDDDLDDYSFLANSNSAEPEMSRNSHGSEKFQDAFHNDEALHSHKNSFYPKANQFELRGNSFERAEFKNSKDDEKFDPGTQQITLTDVKSDVDPFGSSLGVLKKANENANILGKNLLKSLNRYGYDENWKEMDKFQDDKAYEGDHNQEYSSNFRNRLNKRKMDWQMKLKRSHEFPQIGSRLFYAAKTEMYDNDGPQSIVHFPQIRGSRENRNVYYRFSKKNPLNAELRDAENEFEYESEENGIHFKGNLVNNGKINEAVGNKQSNKLIDATKDGKRNVKNEKDATVRNNEKIGELETLEDVAENLENDGESISEDNVLENVIGKYIMRKSVKAAPESGLKEIEKSNKQERSKSHNKRKRSLEDQIYLESFPSAKIIKKRLSAGHLTETNYRKYHKKNLHRKRFAVDTDSQLAYGKNKRKVIARETKNELMSENDGKNADKSSGEPGNGKKRSALDILKKITNKDKENKKAENVDPRTAGFEPLLSSDKNYESSVKEGEDFSMPFEINLQSQDKSNVLGSNTYNNEDENVSEKKKEKSKEELKGPSADKVDGPWKIELNEKYDVKVSDRRLGDSFNNGLTEKKAQSSLTPKQKNQDVKAFLVISKSVRAANRIPSTAEANSPTSGASQREVGKSYRRKSEKGAGFAEKLNWKRSLESPIDWLKSARKDAPGSEAGINRSPKESRLSMQERNRALHDAKSLSEGDSNAQPPRTALRNPETTSFVTNKAQYYDSGEKNPSRGKLTNRKSVFPPSSEENIIGDNRHLNEETSKYLGRQIVNAILAQVSSNPKFKELIAPGLSSRRSCHQEDTEDKRRTLNHMQFSEQVQDILQKLMYDIEKLAEKHVKRRMCNKIDKQSKEFLHSLLNVDKTHDIKDFQSRKFLSSCPNLCRNLEDSNVEVTPTPRVFTSTESYSTSSHPPSRLENLKRKQSLLRKLIEDYRNLSQIEKQRLDINFQYLLRELQQTNRELGYPDNQLYSSTNSPHDSLPSNLSNKNITQQKTKPHGFEPAKKFQVNVDPTEASHDVSYQENSTENVTKSATTQETSAPFYGFEPTEEQNVKNILLTSTTTASTTEFPNSILSESIFNLEPEDKSTMTTPLSTMLENFEKVAAANLSTACIKSDNLTTSPAHNLRPIEPGSSASMPTPESFDLLPCQTSTMSAVASQKPTSKSASKLKPPSNSSPVTSSIFQNSERVRIKQSLPKDFTFPVIMRTHPCDDFTEQPDVTSKPNELHKLGIGDAAGLALGWKYRGPWMSNLDFAKGAGGAGKMGKPVVPPLPNGLSAEHLVEGEDQPYHSSVEDSFADDSNTNHHSGGWNQRVRFGFSKYLGKPLSPSKRNSVLTTGEADPFLLHSRCDSCLVNREDAMRYYLKNGGTPNKYSKKTVRNTNSLDSPYFEVSSLRRQSRSVAKNKDFYLEKKNEKLKKENTKSVEVAKSSNDDYDVEEDPGLEYLIWSSMPSVRRRLNNLEMGVEVDRVALHSLIKKNSFKGKDPKVKTV